VVRSKRKQRGKDVPPELGDHVVHDQGIWMKAVEDLRRGLSAHCRDSKPDKLRFQDGRLEWNLWERIKAEAGEDWLQRNVWLFRCYRVITTYRLGYDEPLRLHVEEMKALEVQETPHSFCRTFRRRFEKDPLATAEELWFRVKSIASWMEVRESFSQWLAFKEDRDYWQDDPDKRARAFQARILASWMTYLGIYEYEHNGRRVRGMRLWEGLGVGTNDKGVPWSPRDWANILEQAARIAEKGNNDCTSLEQWVWWCYPVFSRYGWSAREVQDAASFRKFADMDSLKVIKKYEARFRRYWMTRGLRFAGRKTNRKKPPLAEFVRGIAVPTLDTVRGVVVFRDFPWIPYEKKMMGRKE
jgi:hypothetical protein